MSSYPVTPRSQVRRGPARARYERETVASILDAGFLAHVGFVHEGSPRVIPFVYARVDDAVALHGSTGNRLLRSLAEGAEACVTVTHLDGLVLARSAFHHSVNYRSVVLWGRGRAVEDPARKGRALQRTVETATPGRWKDVRPPDAEELRRTLVVEIPFDEASAKVRTGGPVDDAEDMEIPCWAGVLPLSVQVGAPLPDPDQPGDRELPPYLASYTRLDRSGV